MATQVTLHISDDTYQKVLQEAAETGRSVDEILSTWIEHSSVNLATLSTESVEMLSDTEVMALAESQMESNQSDRLSDLLQAQQARELTKPEQIELDDLLKVYQQGLLHKAQALREAVHRGLREPLNP